MFLFKMGKTALLIFHWKQTSIIKSLQERPIWLKSFYLEGNSINEGLISQPSCSEQG